MRAATGTATAAGGRTIAIADTADESVVIDVHASRGEQTVRVEHVHVEPGAQAIVGPVYHGGRKR